MDGGKRRRRRAEEDEEEKPAKGGRTRDSTFFGDAFWGEAPADLPILGPFLTMELDEDTEKVEGGGRLTKVLRTEIVFSMCWNGSS